MTFSAITRTEKSELRKKYSALRDLIPQDIKNGYDAEILARLTSSISFRTADNILLYASFKSEADTWGIFDAAISSGKKVAFPKCKSDSTIAFYYVSSKDELSKQSFGILEPKNDVLPFDSAGRSICIVPGLVFDRQGYRIGYGKGYYDRFLASYDGVTIGITYSQFILPTLPKGRFDRHVDILITERSVYAVNE